MTLDAGDTAPAFELLDQDGETVRLGDFTGRSLVVYFYPKAFTGGCTKQACDFRDRHEAFAAAGYEIVGISPDPVERLGRFRDEHTLPFPVLSDPDHAVAEAYGAWGTKKNYGREYQGIIRSTFLIGPNGVVTRAMRNVRATGHVERVFNDIG
jgi:peroxiredoxin Q/BCP